MKKPTLPQLSEYEIIILSVILGLIIFLAFGYASGKHSWEWKEGREYREFHFNFISSIVSFIITSGLSYILLKRKEKKKLLIFFVFYLVILFIAMLAIAGVK